MADQAPQRQRRFSPEHKAEAIGLCLVEGLSVAEAAQRLGVSRSSLGRWLRQARERRPEGERLSLQMDRLKAAIDAAEARQTELGARLSILRTETELLSHELSLALSGGAFQPAPVSGPVDQGPDTRERWKPLSRSQLEQDLWVLQTLNWKRGGYFVEFGATDGVLLSNTWLLEKHFGWEGICCEPNPKLFKALEANRRCITRNDCIYRTSGELMEFVLADAYGGLSAHGHEDSHVDKRHSYETAGETLMLTTLSLMDLLEQCGAPREIDYLSVDTEGSELAILEGIDWERHRFRCITIEHNFTAQREGIANLLEVQGYRRIEAEWDDWYVLSRDLRGC